MIQVPKRDRIHQFFLGVGLAITFSLAGNLFADDNEREVKIQCNPPAGAAKALEAYAIKALIKQGAASVKVSVKIKSKESVMIKISDLPASLMPVSRDSLLFRAAPSSILRDGAVGVSCSGDYEAIITSSGIIDNKVIKNAKSMVKLKL